MTNKLELVSMANQIGEKKNKKPYVQRLSWNSAERMVGGEFLRSNFFLAIDDVVHKYEWHLVDDQPYRVGKCVDYTTYSTSLGMYLAGEWKEMTFGEVRRYLELDDHNEVAVSKQAKTAFSIGPDDIDIRDL